MLISVSCEFYTTKGPNIFRMDKTMVKEVYCISSEKHILCLYSKVL